VIFKKRTAIPQKKIRLMRHGKFLKNHNKKITKTKMNASKPYDQAILFLLFLPLF
jgi:hypothetical protein